MTPLADVFKRAADLIDKPGAWIQGHAGATKGGLSIEPRHPLAECWCASGAILKVMGRSDARFHDAVTTASLHVRGKLHQWNDAPERTQAEVVATLRALAERTDHDA